MNKIFLNPINYKDTYLAYLNSCFPNWGNEKTYDWIFERKVGSHNSDILLIKDENNQVIAGSSITYRILKFEDGTSIDFGIMTGSWTLPEARGKGCFSQMIVESKRICFSKNVLYLTAFVTEINASYRRLKDAGFYCKTADNIFSNDTLFSTDTNHDIVQEIPIDSNLLYDKYKQFNSDKHSFAYSNEEFKSQYIDRLNPTFCVTIKGTYYLFEIATANIKLLFASDYNVDNLKIFCDWIRLKYDKKVMFFVSDESIIENLQEHHFHFVKGFFTVKSTDDSIKDNHNVFEKIRINLADKM